MGIVKLAAKFHNQKSEEIFVNSFSEVFPDAESLLRLEPEELGAALLEHINSWSEGELRTLGSQNTTTALAILYPDRHEEIKRILTEGWVWLESEGFLAPLPGSNRGLSFVTRKGKQFTQAQRLDSYRKMKLLVDTLHTRIDEKVRAAFLRGDYGGAVFAAFKEVEVSVREASGASATDIGVDLLNSPFKPHAGPLTDGNLPEPEQLALRSLFAGAIGYYKNPGSHRHVPTDPEGVAGVLAFASVLLRIVDERVASRCAAPATRAAAPHL